MEIDDQKLDIASNLKAMAGKTEEVEKEDSGMEESMGTSPDSESPALKEDSGSDSDDNIFVRSHQRTSRVIADDDDDDSDDDDDNVVNVPVPEAVANDDDVEDDAPLVLDKDESDDDEGSLFVIKRKKKASSQNSSQSSQEKSNPLAKKDLFKTLDADIFDAKGSGSEDNEDSNSDADRSDGDGNDDDDGNNDDDDDEGIDTEALSAKLRRILKKGALKKPKKQQARASKTMAETKMELHSETQRLVRESKVLIPYHQAESKSLSDFMGRAMRKQQQYRALKGNSQDERRKVEFVQDTITHDATFFKRVSLETSTQNSQAVSSQVAEDTAVNIPDIQSQSQAPQLSDPSNTDAAIIIGDSEALPIGDSEAIVIGDSEALPIGDSEAIVIGDSEALPIGDSDAIIIGDSEALPNGDSEALPNASLTENSSLAPGTQEPEINLDAGSSDEEELPDLVISEEPACEEDSSKDVVEPEIFDEALRSNPLDDDVAEGFVPEEESMDVEDSSNWVVDENGLLKTDDPMMDALVATDYKEKSTLENSEASLMNVDVPVEKKESDKSEECKKSPPPSKLSVSRLLTPEINRIRPKLSGSWDQPIVFDDDPKMEVKTPGLDKLMQRCLEHSVLKKPKETSKKVDIKIVQKEETENNKQELCLNTITYQPEEPENLAIKADNPGAKLGLLKDKLQIQMRMKRESARQKRCEIFQMNEEEGYEGEEDGLLDDEEEAELTDGSDTDVSEEEDLVENDLGEDYGKEKRPKSDFVDEEADEDEEEEEDPVEDAAEDEEEEKSECQPKRRKQRDEEEVEDGEKVLFDDSTSDSFLPETQSRPKIKKIIKNLILSDEESENNSIQYKDKKAEKDSFQKTDFGGTFPTTTTTTTTSESEPKTPSTGPFIKPLVMPAEDSQDLYKSSSDFQSPELTSQSLSFPLESQASPMFDEQGFLRVNSLTKMGHESKISALDELCDNDDNADDILGLCSGKFTGTQDDKMKSCRTLFDDSQSESQFPSQFPSTGSFPFSSQVKSDEKKEGIEGEEETEDFPSLKLLSDDEEDEFFRRKKNKRKEIAESSEDEEEEEGDTDEVEEEEGGEENEEYDQAFPTFRNKSSKKMRSEFVDAEAELSGSEYDSDEDDNLNDEYDVMEEEAGDLDVNMTEEQLRNQVNRVHLKNMIDEDKREVMRLQEMYLPDGDLFSEGNGRTRRFRWKGLDGNSQQDLFNDEPEAEEEKEEEETDDLKWRVERYEREKWMQEQEAEEEKNKEDSPLLKFGSVYMKKKGTKLPVEDEKSPKQSKVGMFKNFKKGSFLSRSRDSLAKIAEMTKPVTNTTVSNKNKGRGFVFSVVTSGEEKEKAVRNGLLTHLNVSNLEAAEKKKPEAKNAPPAKKRKIEPVKRTLSETSVFRHF